jgi:hypothetical protein
MTDLLAEIDAGIARHRSYEGSCYEDGQNWPCETLKALQGWREAEVERARLQEAVVEGERLGAEKVSIVAVANHNYAQWQAAEAKLKDAEEKMRGLVEAAQRVVDRCELSGGWKAMNALEEALTQAKREGE